MGPGGLGTLTLLSLAFVAGVLGIARLRAWPLKLLCAAAAFLTAAGFGVGSVNHYYGYYDTWSALATDLSDENGASALPVQIPLLSGVVPTKTSDVRLRPDLDPWSLRRIALPGGLSGVRGRQALVVLPPPSLVHGPLPVLVFLHGEPGTPATLTTGLHLVTALQRQAALGRIGGMAVVLPDVRGAVPNQQCLNVPKHAALATWLRTEVPGDIASQLEVQPPGPAWVAAGLSEGGYCAADLVLHAAGSFAGAAEIDGYNEVDTGRGLLKKAFAGSHLRALRDSPKELVARWPASRRLPAFWLMAGTGNVADYKDAVAFGTMLGRREDLRFVTVEKGRHTKPAWIVALPDMLRWAWLTTSGHPSGGSVDLALP